MISEKIGYVFKDKSVIDRALTHPSKSKNNYQRLEFLGDSILNFVVGDYLFEHCDKSEGRLTVLRSHFVSEEHLAQVFDELGLEEFVIVGKSMKNELTESVKGDIIEAIIAGIYIDGGLDEAKKFILNNLHIENFESTIDDNYKSQLQELVQANFKCSMRYETVKTGEYFEAKFYMDEDLIATGYGKDKTRAEQNCACVALKKLFIE